MSLPRSLCLTLFSALWLLVGCVWVQDSKAESPTLIASQDWLMDASGKATLDEVMHSPDWAPMTGWKGWGFGPEPIWLRVKVRAADTNAHALWAVRVRPAFLDYVTLYDPAAHVVLRTGDALPPSQDALESINSTLPLQALAYERTIYLQIRSSSTRAVFVDVLPAWQAQQRNRLHEWGVGFAVVLSAIFAMWALGQWFMTRERLIGMFALKQVCSTVWGFSILGFARMVIGADLPEGVLSAFTVTMSYVLIVAIVLFYATLFELYQASRFWVRVFRLFAIVMLIGCIIFPVFQFPNPSHTTVFIVNVAGLVVDFLLIVLWVSAFPKRVKQPISLTTLLVYLLFYIASNGWIILMALGLIDMSAMMLSSNLVHAVLDGMVMFVMLQIRARNLQAEHQKLTFNLERSEQTAEAEKRHREEQSQLFAMLAHELKTPLATMRMWMEAGPLKRDKMDRAIADMNEVIERCVHTGQLADQGLEPVMQAVDPVTLTRTCINSCRMPEQVKLMAPNATTVLRTDAQMLSIVLGNLLDNACKYSAPNEPIDMSLQRVQHQDQWGWQWRVDNVAGAAGVPDATHLFEKYYRSPQARRVSGSGLGLFLVKGLLGLMEGTIDYENDRNRVVFQVWVPEQMS